MHVYTSTLTLAHSPSASRYADDISQGSARMPSLFINVFERATVPHRFVSNRSSLSTPYERETIMEMAYSAASELEESPLPPLSVSLTPNGA